jgi:hypothetical protein
MSDGPHHPGPEAPQMIQIFATWKFHQYLGLLLFTCIPRVVRMHFDREGPELGATPYLLLTMAVGGISLALAYRGCRWAGLAAGASCGASAFLAAALYTSLVEQVLWWVRSAVMFASLVPSYFLYRWLQALTLRHRAAREQSSAAWECSGCGHLNPPTIQVCDYCRSKG